MEHAHPPCSPCAEIAGEVSAPGGIIHDDGMWLVSHHTGPFTDPGELIVTAERIYAVSFNERVRHLHFLLLPRTAAMPRGHVISDLYRRARNLLRRLGVLRNPTPADRAETATRIRQEWGA